MTSKQPFEAVVEAHGRTVLRVCRAVLGPVDADDAWSETFLSALKAYPDLPADANVEAWLVTIAHRKAIDVHPRRGPARGARSSTLARDRRRAPTPPGRRPRPDRRGARRLPAKQRHAVAYHYLAGLPLRRGRRHPRQHRRRRPARRRRRHRDPPHDLSRQTERGHR